jgi:spore photoproduct lyase
MIRKYRFDYIFIEKSAVNDEITKRVIHSYPEIEVKIVSYNQKFQDYLSGLSISQGKKTLWLTRFKGKFLKPCPGTSGSYRCCNYLVINEITNCPIDCTYCILQGYINTPVITIYTNYQKISKEIDLLSSLNPKRILRIGTGELTDSLALDAITGLSRSLINKIQQLHNILFELKTKTNSIDHLLHLNPKKVVLSWSINPEEIIIKEEFKSASIFQRLNAIKKAAHVGFLIGLHFDPILWIPDWQSLYYELIKQIVHFVDPDNIIWISLGSLRYPRELKEIAQKRFPKSKIFTGEQIIGLDGKSRYIRPLRKKMYKFIHQELTQTLNSPFIYFCMESEDLWRDIIGKSPKNNLEVDYYFAESIYKKFPFLNLPNPEYRVYSSPINFK